MMSFLRNLVGLGTSQRTRSLEMEVESLNDQIIALTGELSLCEKERDHLAADLIYFSKETKRLEEDKRLMSEFWSGVESKLQARNDALKLKSDRLSDILRSALATIEEN